MFLVIDNHPFHFEMENICRVFFPLERIEVVRGAECPGGGDAALTGLKKDAAGNAVVSASVSVDGRQADFQQALAADAGEKARELAMADCLFSAFVSLCAYVPPWGMLTGVRPSKLMRTLIEGMGEDGARQYFEHKLHVSEEKTALAAGIAAVQRPIIACSGPRSFSLYISIPFCPTRCSYCSFVSHSIAWAKKLIAPYVSLLCTELRDTARIANELGLRLESVYFGGGTPTVLDAQDIRQLADTLDAVFDMSNVREYTVEAGRPDTVTKEKLVVLKKAGVTRLSINPQSFDDAVLEKIGRKHTSRQTLEAFLLAREQGFENINMDFIAGLPGDSAAGFSAGIQKAVALGAENVTVHTLAFKRSAGLVTEKMQQTAFQSTEELLAISKDILQGAGYQPYYMYRQSKSVGNLENTGWAKPGFECEYNIYMMEEIHTVLAAGAGAVTKLKAPNSSLIERIFNFKYPYEYIDRFAEMQARKERIGKFYGEYQ
ncbi:MAG: coproporphyrinogen dehydrogenase HemZ [Oscillospiraceae bacterium]|jgi:oxygen-independent coproporphyrinogen-3 oxidase|nr:coproporphyrinogen dehydrogenase HemZ [Oscillospiraceae bacterium]